MTRELNKAADAYHLLAQAYPRDSTSYNQLGLIYAETGEDEKAIPELQQAIRLAHSVGVFYGNLMGAYRRLDRFDEGKAVAEQFFGQSGILPAFT